MKRVRTLLVVSLLLAFALTALAQTPAPTVVVPTHPRLAFRKDDLPRLRERCLTTHAAEYAVLKSAADRAAALDMQPFAAGFLWQLTGESRYLAWAESDYDAFNEVLDAATARRLANDVLYNHRRRMSAVDGRPAIGDVRYMTVFDNRSDVLTLCGDDVPLARPGELASRLRVLAQAFREARETYAAIAHRRGGKNTSFHCACFFNDVPRFYEKWRVATGENHFTDTLMTGLILQGAHNTLPLEHGMAPMTNSWGHDHLGRPAEYLIAS
ncbi:MAG TPA: hypothetical protein VMX57_07575, partial [Planctomycetota bacterium]|nr:hypothetical protein [Planctomycetota bacterium]